MGLRVAHTFNIEPAAKHDAAELMNVAMVTWRNDIKPALKIHPDHEARELMPIRTHIERHWRHAIVARDDNGILGWISRSNPEYVAYLLVLPEMQNGGIGTALLARMENMVLLEGHMRLQLDTFIHRKSALRFYLKNGYEPANQKSARAVASGKDGSARLVKQLTHLPTMRKNS